LTGVQIVDEQVSLMKALNLLHSMGPKVVVISSTSFGENKDKEIVLYASLKKEGSEE